MSARCDECGAVLPAVSARCDECGAALDAALATIERVDEARAEAGWRVLRVATFGYALAQLALMAAGAWTDALPRAHLALRLSLLAGAVLASLWIARRRARAWLGSWATLLSVGSLVALSFLLTGLAPRSVHSWLTWCASGLWSGATAAAAWRVHRSVEAPGGSTGE